MPVDIPAAIATKSPATATLLTGEVVALENIALDILVHSFVPTITYSLKDVGATAQVVLRKVEPLPVILATWPAPVPRIMIAYALELGHMPDDQAFVLSFRTAVEPGAPDEQIPRSPLIYKLGFVPSALSSTAYIARSNSKKCHLRVIFAGLNRK